MKQGKLVKMLSTGKVGRIEFVMPACVLEDSSRGDYCKIQFDVLSVSWHFDDEFEIVA